MSNIMGINTWLTFGVAIQQERDLGHVGQVGQVEHLCEDFQHHFFLYFIKLRNSKPNNYFS